MKETYGDKRRTKIVKGKINEISDEDLIAQEETLITITHSGYVKEYHLQHIKHKRGEERNIWW